MPHRAQRVASLLSVLLLLAVTGCASGGKGGSEAPAVTGGKLGDTPNVARYGSFWFSGQFTEADLSAIREAGIAAVLDLRNADEERGFEEEAAVRKEGLEYYRVEIRKRDYERAALEEAMVIMDEWFGEKPLLIQCSSSNRVGMVFALWRYTRDGLTVEAAVEEGKKVGLAKLEDQTWTLLENWK